MIQSILIQFTNFLNNFLSLKVPYCAAKEKEFLGYVLDPVCSRKNLEVDSEQNAVNTPKIYCIALREEVDCRFYGDFTDMVTVNPLIS